MSVVFKDGAKHYTDPAHKWASWEAVEVASAAPRRPGTRYLLMNGYVQTPVLALTNRGVIGIALKIPTNNHGAITLYSGGTAQMCVCWDAARSLHVKRGDELTGTILASSDAGVVPLNSWFHLGFDGTVDDASGAAQVFLNGPAIDDLTLTGVDTKPSAVTGVDRVRISGGVAVSATDIYIDSNTFHGDCVIDTLMPTGAGAHADFTPSAGANYQNIDDSEAIDDDETYNASAAQDDIDTFVFANLTAMPTSEIISVAVNLALRKDDATTRVVKPVIRIGTTDYLHGTGISPGGLYMVAQRIWETNPADSGAWEEADVNGAEFGYKQTLVS